MTYAEALDYLHGLAVFGARFGLEPMRRMAARLDNPQERLRFIHVAGTNGKGSTCAMLESIYRASGLRVGLFTSPHLVSFRERLQVNRELISEGDVARLVTEVIRVQCAAVDPEGGPASFLNPHSVGDQHAPPTFFEFVTGLALKYFAEQKCDVVLWETGLGGRLDATNIVTPLASVITNIALDHQEWLGDTLAKIAAEKAGIIKPGVPVFTGADAPEALAVIQMVAEQIGSPLTIASNELPMTDEGGVRWELPLAGAHQQRNASLAIAVVAGLQRQLTVSATDLRRGLATVQWAGRLQGVTVRGQKFVLDGAHNLNGVQALVATVRRESSGQTFALVVGMLADKDCAAMCRELAPLANRIVAVRVPSARSSAPKMLTDYLRDANPAAEVTAQECLASALTELANEPRVFIAGSLYLIGEAMELLGIEQAGGERLLNEWQPTRSAVSGRVW